MKSEKSSSTSPKWITLKEPENKTRLDDKNPWEFRLTREDQTAPLPDCGGLCLFRKSFIADDIRTASISITALGIFDLYINGKRIGKTNGSYDELKPGWSDFRKRVLYYTYDISDDIRSGENTVLVAVAPGWYNGRIALGTYGKTHISLLADLSVTEEKATYHIITDNTWEAVWGGPVRTADIWDGEYYDANEPSFEDISVLHDSYSWSGVTTEERDIIVSPNIGPTIQTRPELSPDIKSISVYNGITDNGTDFGKIKTIMKTTENAEGSFRLKKGETAVIDFGQNLVGWPGFKALGKKGTMILVRFSEMLNDSGLLSRKNDGAEGSIYTSNYRCAKSKIHYILKGSGEESYHPSFTFFGFRYCEITATDDVEFLSLKAEVVGSATVETGHIETSDKNVNRLISNITWGQRGNYLSVPTDCPQRDERLGWTGDTQAFVGTASYNADVREFFHKWLQDARDSQAESGAYSDVIPRSRVIGEGSGAWSDAGIIVPYTVWKMYGDTDIIKEHFDSMEKYMEWIASRGMNGPNPTYGDWLAYEGTDPKYISLCYYAIDAQYMRSMSAAAGRTDRAEYYSELYDRIKKEFTARYCIDDGELKEEFRTQTGYLLAIRNRFFDEKGNADAIRKLKEKIIKNGYRLSTGFVGSCILNEVLAESGENNLAYSLLLQTGNPSWLYSVLQGATTIWEHWDSYTIDQGFVDSGMSSFNHYAYGSVGEWMYRHIGGIETTEKDPGFAHPVLQPKPDTRADSEIPDGQKRITWAKSSLMTKYGRIVSNWHMDDGFTYECEVPCQATVCIPIIDGCNKLYIDGKDTEFRSCTASGKEFRTEISEGKHVFRETI